MLNIANNLRNANQYYNEVSPHSGQNDHHQKFYKNQLVKFYEKLYWDLFGIALTFYISCKVLIFSDIDCSRQYDPAILLLGIYPEKNENTNLKRYMYPSVHSSIIYSSQDMEATQVPINR